ncbi:MAG TPA: branched-chain amino acid ABC transporter substrate-binding protein, partial [Xanthobacteraceae bacterium]
MKRAAFVASLAVTGFVAAGAYAAEPITLGWVGPLSAPGNFASGQEMQWADQLEVDQINAAGGVLGRHLK